MNRTFNVLLFIFLLAPLFAADAANDIILTQRKPDNSGSIQRNVPAQSAIGSTLASYRSAIGLGTEDAPEFNGLTLTGNSTFSGNITSTANVTASSGTWDLSLATVTFSSSQVPWAALNKSGSSLADLATRSASDLSSGTLPDARFPATLPALNASLLTNLNASNLSSGTVPTARLSATAILDTIGSTRGSVVYRGAAGWAPLTPGTANYALVSQGAGADPVYAAIVNSIAGTSSQIAVSGSTGAVTLSIPTNPVLPGNVTVTGGFTLSGSSNMAIQPGTALYLDGGGNTYLTENTADNVRIVAGGLGALDVSASRVSVIPTTASTSTTTGSLITGGGVGIGGALYVGGAGGITMTSGVANFVMQPGAAFYLDGGGNTYITEHAPDKIRMVAGNVGTVDIFSTQMVLNVSTASTSSATGSFVTGGGIGAGGAIFGADKIVSTSATGGIGYAAGAGGTVTQLTSKSTGVTLNKVTGEITMNGAALAAATIVSFTLTNSAVAAGDAIWVQHVATGTLGGYGCTGVAGAGTATIYVRNNTAGSLSEAIVLKVVIIKAATS